MSRLAKKPIEIPAKVTAQLDKGTLTITGPLGTITRTFQTNVVGIEITSEGIVCTPKETTKFGQSLLGTYASHIRNMVQGVVTGYEKKLILEGVGFRIAVSGKKLDMALGFSHPVSVEIPEGLTVTSEKNVTTIRGIDKELVGSFTASIRALKKPEPYKGKGMRYHDEVLLRKQGKKSA